MAHVNTGKAFAEELIVHKTVGSATTSTSHSVLAEIPNTSFRQLTLGDFALLSVEQAQARYAALQQHVQAQYAGLDISSALTNEPIKEDVSLCPLPGTQTYYRVTATGGGNGAATVNGAGNATVSAGTSVSLAATPNTGYEFDGWYIGGVKQHTLGATATYQATADVTLEARFKKKDEPVLINNYVTLNVQLNSGKTADVWVSTLLPVASAVNVEVEDPDKTRTFRIEIGNTESNHFASPNIMETNDVHIESVFPHSDEIYRYA